ncbi:glycosyltransferase [Candidatus Daviesbacteria bacterium]|nr:glycosyltransferase [Candidatus Daviesbacteria bacterium]
MAVNHLSVFFPAYNEEKNILSTVTKAVEVLKKLNLKDFEVIVVDDGSKDNTAQVVYELSKKDKRIRLIAHQTNKGYGHALKTGFSQARFEWVAFSDSDGQFDFSDITKLLEESDSADFVLGYRIKRADPFLRKLFTFGWKTIAGVLFGLKVIDYSCGFKLIKKQAFESCLPLESEEKVTQIELLVKAMKKGYHFAEVGVNHYSRKFGNPTGANIKVVLKSLLDILKLWWNLEDKKPLFLTLLAILLLAAFLRFYRLNEYMTFLGDEGRDMLIMKKILVELDLPLIGPSTSVGNIYLGPLYYYMMAIPSFLFWMNPTASAGMNALIGVLTVYLIYYLAKIWFGRISALTVAFLYAISPIAIIYSRSSWNPNPAPLFTLLGILGFFNAHTTRNFKWLILTGVSFAAAAQMHYLALILIPIAGVIWATEALNRKSSKKSFWLGTILGIISYLALMTPLVVFDLKHNFLNFRAMKELFVVSDAIKAESAVNFGKFFDLVTQKLVNRYIVAGNETLTFVLLFMILVPIIWMFVKALKQKSLDWPNFILGVWLIVGLIGLTFYQKSIYDHYLGFISPAAYLLVASFISMYLVKFKNANKLVKSVPLIVLIIMLALVNFQKSPLKDVPNNQLKRTQEIAKYIIKQSENRPFNFALLAERNYDSAYQFYLWIYGHRPKQVPFDITDQLFVVCEDSVCDPVYSPKYEIAGYGWSKVDEVKEVSGVKVYKLSPNPSGKP